MKRATRFFPMAVLLALILAWPGRAPAQSGTPHGVYLSWSASTSSGVTGYNVYRWVGTGVPTSPLAAGVLGNAPCAPSAPAGSLCYVDSTVAINTTYTYSVTAVAAGNESAASPQANVTTPATLPINPNPPSGLAGVIK